MTTIQTQAAEINQAPQARAAYKAWRTMKERRLAATIETCEVARLKAEIGALTFKLLAA